MGRASSVLIGLLLFGCAAATAPALPFHTLSEISGEQVVGVRLVSCGEQAVMKVDFVLRGVHYLYFGLKDRFVLARWNTPENQPDYLWWGTAVDGELHLEGEQPYEAARHGESPCPLLLQTTI